MDVFTVESLWKVEVDLQRRKLPQAPNCIHQLDINLRPIKRGLAGDGLVPDIFALQHILKRLDGVDPLLFTTHKILAIVRIPRRKLRLELIEAKIFQYIQGKIQATTNL